MEISLQFEISCFIKCFPRYSKNFSLWDWKFILSIINISVKEPSLDVTSTSSKDCTPPFYTDSKATVSRQNGATSDDTMSSSNSFGAKLSTSVDHLDICAQMGSSISPRMFKGRNANSGTMNLTTARLLIPPPNSMCMPLAGSIQRQSISTTSLDGLTLKSVNHVSPITNSNREQTLLNPSIMDSGNPRKIMPYFSSTTCTAAMPATARSRMLSDDQASRLQALKLQPTGAATSGGWI